MDGHDSEHAKGIPGPGTSQLVRRGALVPPKMEEDYEDEVVICFFCLLITDTHTCYIALHHHQYILLHHVLQSKGAQLINMMSSKA